MAVSRLCSIPDCGKAACNGRGWCNTHYLRWRRHGDPVGGRTPNGHALAFLETALAHEGDECLIWPYLLTPGGYGSLYYEGRRHIVSRLICTKVNGPPPTPQHEAAHSCGRGADACVAKRHLSWKTRVANQADRIDHGTTNRGERCGGAKLTEGQVREMRSMKGTMPQSEIAARFGVRQSTVSEIMSGRKWGWL